VDDLVRLLKGGLNQVLVDQVLVGDIEDGHILVWDEQVL
jgi:hypothetical protein